MKKIYYWLTAGLIWAVSSVGIFLYFNQFTGRGVDIYSKIVWFSVLYGLMIVFSYPKKGRSIKSYFLWFGTVTLIEFLLGVGLSFFTAAATWGASLVLIPALTVVLSFIFIVGLYLVTLATQDNKSLKLLNLLVIGVLALTFLFAGSVAAQQCTKDDWQCLAKQALKNPTLCNDPINGFLLGQPHSQCVAYLAFYSGNDSYCSLIQKEDVNVHSLSVDAPPLTSLIVNLYAQDKSITKETISDPQQQKWIGNCKMWVNYKSQHPEIVWKNDAWLHTGSDDIKPSQLSGYYGNIINLDITPEEHFRTASIKNFSDLSAEVCKSITPNGSVSVQSYKNNNAICLMYAGIFKKDKQACNAILSSTYDYSKIEGYASASSEFKKNYSQKYSKQNIYNMCVKFADIASNPNNAEFFNSKDKNTSDVDYQLLNGLLEGRVWDGYKELK